MSKPQAICPKCGWECIRINHNQGMGYQSLDCVSCLFSAIDGTMEYYKAIQLGTAADEPPTWEELRKMNEELIQDINEMLGTDAGGKEGNDGRII